MTYLDRHKRLDIQNALEMLPTDCLYHGKRFVRVGTCWRTHSRRYGTGLIEPCCDTGAGAFVRHFARVALGVAQPGDAEWPHELRVTRTP